MSRAGAGARRRACAAALLVAGVALLVPQGAHAQTVVVTAPPGDTLRSATPTFFIQTSDFSRAGPLRVRFEISTSPQFTAGSIVLDTTLSTDSSVTVAPRGALEENIQIYWRARAVDVAGVQGMSPVGGPRITPTYLTLVSPRTGNGVTVRTRRPVFVWRSAPVNEPPGPWVYELEITNLGRAVVTTVPRLDTTFVPEIDLETNAPYRWSVRASLPGTITTTLVQSSTTFIIIDTTATVAQTLLYQNFPNPFPTAAATSTCIRFDLGETARVELDVYDLRGRHVRRMRPGPDGVREMTVGRYGLGPQSNTECDPDYRWDGTDGDGRTVAPGVYLVRLRAGAYTSTKKILFRGR